MKRCDVQGVLYCLIHFCLEVVSFYVVTSYIHCEIIWVLAFLYDFLAFVPQGVFGYFADTGRKGNPALIGAGMTMAALLLMRWGAVPVAVVTVVAVGNCLVHIQGAETTLCSSEGRIAPGAVFVSGGSFGVVTGRMVAGFVPVLPIMALNLIMIVLIIFSGKLKKGEEPSGKTEYRFAKAGIKPEVVVLLATGVVAIRSFMGFAIPTGWKETTAHTVFLYCAMGIGKAAGGILTDRIGARKTALISTMGALPFLILGDHIMGISLIGILLFSMTMAVTLGLVVSALWSFPGVAFGFTTIGLFLGALPTFFYRLESSFVESVVLVILTAVSMIVLNRICEDHTAAEISKKQFSREAML